VDKNGAIAESRSKNTKRIVVFYCAIAVKMIGCNSPEYDRICPSGCGIEVGLSKKVQRTNLLS
jgi:hypothetical protein